MGGVIINEKPRIELHLGDCLEIMKSIPDKSIDLVLTDPPYPDYYQNDFQYKDGIIDFLKEIKCRQFIFWSAKIEFPLSYTARHIWDKITGAANQWDFIYERNGQRRQKVYRGHRINSSVSAQFAKEKFSGHKAQKPLEVINKIIEQNTNINYLILDPFMGSGTTGVACKKLGRNFIGIEIEPKYFEIAKRRIEQTTTDMFVGLETKMQDKVLRKLLEL